MPEEVIPPRYAFKGCLITGCSAVLLFILVAVGYLVYLFYFNDSLDFE
ncbi:MAG: hypothetical protein AAF717_10195 [Bacteroidota bacterium]